jgi:hypothetical protein
MSVQINSCPSYSVDSNYAEVSRVLSGYGRLAQVGQADEDEIFEASMHPSLSL